jgi:hypothetical protein
MLALNGEVLYHVASPIAHAPVPHEPLVVS